jgi:starch phosphorylase
MQPLATFVVSPALPERLARLRDLAYNLRWSWDHATIELFRRLDSDLWESSGHNPVRMLGTIDQARLDAAANDDGFLSHLDGVARYFDDYMAGQSTWFKRTHGAVEAPQVAYFSAEFGVTECLSIFAGGLGVLAGDHLKSASDLGVPLAGVGLLYQQGYFRQQLNEAGWQQESYEENDFHTLPLSPVRRPNGTQLVIELAYPGRTVAAQVWRAQVGRVPLYLLDTNIPTNSPADRDITDQLYGGDLDMRIRQEILLGIGGYRALRAMGLEPPVCHMNEGHSAFLSLERARYLMERHKLSFAQAREAASAGLIFTTHTPVAAGQDYFPPDLMARYFTDYARALGLPWNDFLALGRENPADGSAPFCMTVLALRMANQSNGVSRLHGEVSRQMWQGLWPGVPVTEVPIGHVTNGVHFSSWISLEMKQLYDRYLGPRWREEPADEAVWQRVGNISVEELWRTHERRRERLVAFARRRLHAQLEQRRAPLAEIESAEEVLSSQALTIGFARRFATYKRATLLLQDPDRLARLLNDAARPVQILFAGKAHPRDEPGKELIRQIVALARQPDFRRHIVFLEDYDMAVARYLVQGCDIWLNTPRRPREASGTSGMKATANGVLNLSALDGWWDEAYRPDLGWAIGRTETYVDTTLQDQVEAEALYEILERDVVPTFYDRGTDGLPRRWIARMKTSIGTLCHFFNTHRMVAEYSEHFYIPAVARFGQLEAESMAGARALAAWKARLREAWPQLEIKHVDVDVAAEARVGDTVQVQARVHLGPLRAGDVAVELIVGGVDGSGNLVATETIPMTTTGAKHKGIVRYTAGLVLQQSGQQGYTVRVLPHHPGLPTPFLPGLIAWAGHEGHPE